MRETSVEVYYKDTPLMVEGIYSRGAPARITDDPFTSSPPEGADFEIEGVYIADIEVTDLLADQLDNIADAVCEAL